METPSREAIRRWVAPLAFLAGLTIAVVLIQHGLSRGGSPSAASSTAVVTRTATAPSGRAGGATSTSAGTGPGKTTTNGRYYVVQRGDTFSSIAARYGTTVQQIEALNPGVSSNSLTIGQKIRVK